MRSSNGDSAHTPAIGARGIGQAAVEHERDVTRLGRGAVCRERDATGRADGRKIDRLTPGDGIACDRCTDGCADLERRIREGNDITGGRRERTHLRGKNARRITERHSTLDQRSGVRGEPLLAPQDAPDGGGDNAADHEHDEKLDGRKPASSHDDVHGMTA
jgi:hypothetical protein